MASSGLMADKAKWLRQELAEFRLLEASIAEIFQGIKAPMSDGVLEALGELPDWAYRYQNSLVANWIMLHTLAEGMPAVRALAGGGSSREALGLFDAVITTPIEFDALPPDVRRLNEKQLKRNYLEMVIASKYAFDSVMCFGESIPGLVRKMLYEDDDKALFKAVGIDPVAINCPPCAERVRQAQITGDGKFLAGLRGAMGKPSGKFKSDYRQLRFAVFRLEFSGQREHLTQESAYRLLAEDLGLYPTIDGEAGSLWTLINRWTKEMRHENVLSCRGPEE